MNFVALGIGGLLAAGGAYLSFVQKKKTEGLVTELKFMKAVPLSELKESWQSLSDEGMADGFRDLVETNGKADTDGEVKAPYSNVPCAYYEATVTREFEKEERSTDKDGKVKTRRTRSSETVSSRKSPSPLYVTDGDVRVGIDLDGATLHLKDGEDRFEPYESNKTYTFFGVRFSAPSGVRTLGFRYKEKLIPAGHPLYVVGEARHSAGALRIGRPSEKGKPFIVSVKSEEEVIAGMQGSAKMVFYLGIALMVVGVAVAVFFQ
jgi:hypothetical protein